MHVLRCIPFNMYKMTSWTFYHSIDNHPKIAFYAFTNTLQKNLAQQQSVIFGSTLTNIGNCYHKSTGIFIPNVSGVYVFDVQIVNCYYGYEFVTELVVEGMPVALHFNSDSSFCSSGGGGITTVSVSAGDSVWVRVRSTNGYNDVSWGSTFSGFLLYPDWTKITVF